MDYDPFDLPDVKWWEWPGLLLFFTAIGCVVLPFTCLYAYLTGQRLR